VVKVLLVDEDGAVGGGQPVAALAGPGVRVVDRQKPSHGLLLEPLAHVTLGGAGAPGEVGRRCIPTISECAVEAELAPDVDGCDLQRVDRGREQALHEHIGLLGRGFSGLGHVCLPSRLSASRTTRRIPAKYG
jgi:hypothetical protein